MVDNTIEIQSLPDFLKAYLAFGNDGTVYGAKGSNFFFYPNQEWSYQWGENRIKIFRSIYKLLIESESFKFREIEHDNDELQLRSESEFLNYEFKSPEYFSFSIVLDCQVYWYNNQSKELGLSYLEKGAKINFNSFSPISGASPLSIGVSYYHNLFSNHIATWNSLFTTEPDLYYFGPAAIINRLKIRNIALGIKAKYPDLIVEFESEAGRVSPYDEYGFLEGADIVNQLA